MVHRVESSYIRMPVNLTENANAKSKYALLVSSHSDTFLSQTERKLDLRNLLINTISILLM